MDFKNYDVRVLGKHYKVVSRYIVDASQLEKFIAKFDHTCYINNGSIVNVWNDDFSESVESIF